MTTCAHCLQPTKGRGYGSVNSKPLCHPDAGLDCYHLVTVYRHTMPCAHPACRASARTRTAREESPHEQ